MRRETLRTRKYIRFFIAQSPLVCECTTHQSGHSTVGGHTSSSVLRATGMMHHSNLYYVPFIAGLRRNIVAFAAVTGSNVTFLKQVWFHVYDKCALKLIAVWVIIAPEKRRKKYFGYSVPICSEIEVQRGYPRNDACYLRARDSWKKAYCRIIFEMIRKTRNQSKL